ncbi:MAG: AAA family ATPase [Chloroflexi bacterium]|nr:MAG: AAA family ATPase [Chloroflexota bacterium]
MSNRLNRHSELHALLARLNLAGMAEIFADLALKAAKEGLTHEGYLYELATYEEEQRMQRRTERLLRQSGLPREKTLRTFDVGRLPAALQLQVERLKCGTFLETAVNVIAVGKPGVGKSHLMAAVGYELILQGHPVLWISTATLVQRLLAAKRDLRLPHELAKLDKFVCVMLDDIGYVQHNRDEMEVLFTFLAERYERKSVVITTNLVFSEWERIFKDPMTTMAAIDRVVHHSVILDMMGVESYRAKEAHQQHLRQQEDGQLLSQKTPSESSSAKIIVATSTI